MTDTQPPTSDYDGEIETVIKTYAFDMNWIQSTVEENMATQTEADRYKARKLSDAKVVFKNLVHSEVQKALDEFQHRMLKKNEELLLMSRIDEQGRTDGQFLRFLRREGIDDEESEWITHIQRMNELKVQLKQERVQDDEDS